MSESIKWATLRERAQSVLALLSANQKFLAAGVLADLISDIDAAALAMERQEAVLDAAVAWREECWQFGMGKAANALRYTDDCIGRLAKAADELTHERRNGGADGQ